MCRLGLAHIFLELQEILISTDVRVLEKKQANGAGRVRELIDEQFGHREDWVQSKSGDIDWIKRFRSQPNHHVQNWGRNSGVRQK